MESNIYYLQEVKKQIASQTTCMTWLERELKIVEGKGAVLELRVMMHYLFQVRLESQTAANYSNRSIDCWSRVHVDPATYVVVLRKTSTRIP